MSRFITPGVHDRTRGPAVGAASDGLEGFYRGTICVAPSGGVCHVVLPGMDPLHSFEAYCSAGATGSVGDIVLVAFDDQKFCFLVLNLGRSAL